MDVGTYGDGRWRPRHLRLFSYGGEPSHDLFSDSYTLNNAGPPLTAGQLKALALKGSEVPQEHSVPVQDPVVRSGQKTFPPVSDASCQRALDVLGSETASAHVFQIFNWKENIMGGDSTLASYEGTKAQDAFRQLQESLKTCTPFTGVGWVGKFNAEITVEQAPDVGDAALSFHLTMPLPDGGGLRDEHHVFVRTGNLTVSFQELNVGRKAQFPVGLVKKQVDRLSSAQGG
ncbi:hypothetical protein [Streptomyces sp. SJL17-1]|uniref:hypothetical protein n=1 Tax=Streptomyces sp. SJL17-1 TaxID=2967223 RepID=UPI0029672B80|nr:hypothetical protein [Streptomyces sp. SJL17-1]